MCDLTYENKGQLERVAYSSIIRKIYTSKVVVVHQFYYHDCKNERKLSYDFAVFDSLKLLLKHDGKPFTLLEVNEKDNHYSVKNKKEKYGRRVEIHQEIKAVLNWNEICKFMCVVNDLIPIFHISSFDNKDRFPGGEQDLFVEREMARLEQYNHRLNEIMSIESPNQQNIAQLIHDHHPLFQYDGVVFTIPTNKGSTVSEKSNILLKEIQQLANCIITLKGVDLYG